MNISFFFKNLEPTQALKDYVSEKIKRINERLHHAESYSIRFSIERQNQIFEITIHADATVFHLKKTDKDMYAAIDFALDAIANQVDRYRKKLSDKGPEVIPVADPQPISEDTEITVVDAPGKPMDDLEAVLQLRAAKYRFMMFHRMDEGKYSLVVTRPDGNYSIISPLENEGEYRESVVRLQSGELHEASNSLYPIAHLTIAEAMELLEEGNLEFLAFYNTETGRMNVLFFDRFKHLCLKRPAA